MAALFPSQDTFVRGEISPRLHARASLDLYRAGLSKCENFITLPHGGIRKRGGTYFAGEVKDSTKKARLIPFVFSADQAYALELGPGYMRVYAYGARVGTIEYVTPWAEQFLNELQFVQSADVMWVVHPLYAPHKITRLAHDSWSVSPVDFFDGPFGPVNTMTAQTMTVSAVSGNITITANAAVFNAAMVGQLIRIDMESYTTIQPWESGGLAAEQNQPIDNLRVRYNGNVYVTPGTGFSDGPNGWRFGGTPPTHLKGVEVDGPVKADVAAGGVVGLPWLYLHSGFGVARITGFISPTQVTAAVVSRFPEELTTNPSHLWRLGSFDSGSYANGVTLFEERLAFSERLSVFASKTGDFNSFRLGEKDDDALEFLQAGGGQANDIVWLADADGAMVIGTTGGVRALSGSGVDEALTPSSFKNRKSRAYGCAPVQPVDAGSSFIYLTRSRKALAELSRDSAGRFSSDDVAQVSEHIPKKGVIALAYQNYPDPILWFPLENGELGGFTHQPAQEVRGLHRHRLGGKTVANNWGMVESAVVTPGQTGVDDVWLIVLRAINGVTRRYIEVMQEPFEYKDLSSAFQVDCGLSRNGAPSNTVTGISHLNGEKVDVLADGKVFKGLTVTGGSISLPEGFSASQWHVGLPMPAEAATLELDVGGRDGSMIGRRKKVSKVILSLLETDTTGLRIQSHQRGKWESVKVPTIVPSDGRAALFTGNVSVPVEDTWDGQARIRITHDNPTPCTIRAMTPVFEGEP